MLCTRWLNTRLRILTPTGIAMPKVHYIVLSLILNIAAPDFFRPYSDPPIRNVLHRRFVVWQRDRLNSGMTVPAVLA